MYILLSIIGKGVSAFSGSTMPENITHSHITSTCLLLHNWIKREATIPQNKKAAQLMRTRSGS